MNPSIKQILESAGVPVTDKLLKEFSAEGHPDLDKLAAAKAEEQAAKRVAREAPPTQPKDYAEDEEQRLAPKSRWWENDPKKLMAQVYWHKGQLPPSHSDSFVKNWNKVVDQLSAEFPPPADWENPMPPKDNYEPDPERERMKDIIARREMR